MAGGFLDKKSFKSRIPYQGITSFWRADYSQDLANADFAVYGVPCDVSIVNPYDPSHITAILGATLGMDILYVMAESPLYKNRKKA